MSEISKSSEDRAKMTVEVVPSAMDTIDSFVVRKSVLKKDVMSRLIEWFAALPDSAKSAIMGWVDQDLRAAQGQMLRKLAEQVESGAIQISPAQLPPRPRSDSKKQRRAQKQ